VSQNEFDLGEFLSRQAAGGALESEGEFTVDHAKAARKLARFAMPHEYSWVLKLVQAAVGWEASELRVEQQRLFTSFTFAPGDSHSVPTAKEVVGTVLHGQLESRDPLSRLCIALRSLVEQTGLSFVLGLCSGENDSETLFAGPDVSSMEPTARKNWGSLDTRGLRVTVSHQMRGEFYTGRLAPRFLLRRLRDQEIAAQLRSYAFSSPVPITLNGQAITDPLAHPEFGFTQELRPLLLCGLRSLGDQELFMAGPFEDGLTVPVRANQARVRSIPRTNNVFGGWGMVQVIDPEVYAKRKYNREMNSDELSSLGLWVQDGVVVETFPLLISKSNLTRLVLILDAHGLETDLTGFALQKTEEKSDRFVHALIQAKKLLRDALDAHPHLLSTRREHLAPEDRKSSIATFKRHSLQCAAISAPLALWNPLIGASTLLVGMVVNSVGYLYPPVETAGERYREDLASAIRRISGSSAGG